MKLVNKYQKTFFIVSMLLCNFSYARILCGQHYSSVEKLSIVERFESYSNVHKKDFIVISVDEFSKNEIASIVDSYQKQILVLEQKGTDSKFQSQYNLFNTHVEAVEEKLKTIEKLLSPSRLTKIFSKQSSRLEKLNEEAHKFALCREKMDVCAVNLNQAIRDASQNIFALKNLTEALQNKKQELTKLSEHLGKDVGNGDSSRALALPIIETYVNQLTQMLSTSEAIQSSQSSLLTMALLKLRTDIPEIKQKIEMLIAKEAPEMMREIVKDDIMKSSNEEFPIKQQLSEIINSSVTKQAKLTAVEKTIDSANKIGIEEAYYILDNIPKGVNWGENRQAGEALLPFHRDLQAISGNSWEGFIKTEVIILYKVLTKIKTNKDDMGFKYRKLASKIKTIGQEIIKREVASKKNEYQSDVAILFSRLFSRL